MTNWFITCNWGDVIGVDSQMPGAPSRGGAAVCPLTGNKGVCGGVFERVWVRARR